MALLSLAVFVVGALILCAVLIRAKPVGCPRTLPSYPIIGSLIEVQRYADTMLDLFLKYAPRFNFKTYGFSVPGRCILVISKPPLVEHVLKTKFSNYVKGVEFFSLFEETLGHGIFNIDGPQWLKSRKTASHMFKTRNLRDCMLNVFVEHGHRLETVLEPQLGQQIDLQDYFFRFTFDSICKIAFGLDVCSLQKRLAFADAFDLAQQVAVRRFLNPVWKLQRLLGVGAEAGMARAQRTLDRTVRDMVRTRRQADDAKGRDDLLSLFLNQEGGGAMTDTELRDIIMNFMIAGRDTTACALSWTFLRLHKHPEVMAKVVAEIDEVCGGADPDMDTLKRLVYTEAVVAETLRLYPSVAVDMKFAVADDVLPDGTRVRAGDTVGWVPMAMGRDPELWEDPLEFRPERFIAEGGGSVALPSPFLYTAFNAGPRTCLGRFMAFMEAKTVMVMLLQRFTVAIPHGVSEEHMFSATMALRNGLPAVLQRRST